MTLGSSFSLTVNSINEPTGESHNALSGIPRFSLGSPGDKTIVSTSEVDGSKRSTPEKLQNLEETVSLLKRELELIKAEKSTTLGHWRERTLSLENQLESKSHEFERLQQEHSTQKREALNLAKRLADVSRSNKSETELGASLLKSASYPHHQEKDDGTLEAELWKIFLRLCENQFNENELALLTDRTLHEILVFFTSVYDTELSKMLRSLTSSTITERHALHEAFIDIVESYWHRYVKRNEFNRAPTNESSCRLRGLTQSGKAGSEGLQITNSLGRVQASYHDDQREYSSRQRAKGWEDSFESNEPRMKLEDHPRDEFYVPPVHPGKLKLPRRSRTQNEQRNDTKIPGTGPIKTFYAIDCDEKNAKTHRTNGIRCHTVVQKLQETSDRESRLPMSYMGVITRKGRIDVESSKKQVSTNKGIRVNFNVIDHFSSLHEKYEYKEMPQTISLPEAHRNRSANERAKAFEQMKEKMNIQ